MPPKDPTPEPDADDPGPVEVSDAGDTATGGRKPPGPGDHPISNLPPPSSAEAPAPEQEGTAVPLEDAGATSEDVEEGEDGDPTKPHAYDLADLAALEAELGAAADSATPAVDGGAAEPDPGDDDAAGEADADHGTGDGADGDAADTDDAGAAGTAVDPDADPDPTVPSSPARSRRAPVVAVAVVILLVLGFLQLRRADQLADQRDDRRAVEQVASRFGDAYLSYDFEHADVSAKAVQRLATEAFSDAYEAQSAPGIQELFSSRQTTTAAHTQEVFVGIVEENVARALVVVDVTATSATEGTQRLDDVSFVLDQIGRAHV